MEATLDLTGLEEIVRTAVRDEFERVLETQAESEWLGLDAAASYIGSTKAALRSLVKRQAVPHYKAGGRLRFNRAELDAWVRGRTP